MASVGLRWLCERYSTGPLIPFVQSFTDRRQPDAWPYTRQIVSSFHGSDDPMAHLRFALKHEPLDQRAYALILPHLEAGQIASWVKRQPLSRYARMAWFLFEEHVERIDLPDSRAGRTWPLLDERTHFTAPGRLLPRHRILDNRLGDSRLAPLLRRTEKLDRQLGLRVHRQATQALSGWPEDLVSRAISYLYTKESKTSSEIERVTLDLDREARFLAALRDAPNIDLLDPADLARVQREITEPRVHATGWRIDEVYIGETVRPGREKVHCVFPPADELTELMAAWGKLDLRTRGLDPVLRAALLSFSFVFIHPFEDGNGRMHRLLIHSVLARDGVVPPPLVLPVSASILKHRRRYDEALETFSKPLMAKADYDWDERSQKVTQNRTSMSHYRYFDATPVAEFLVDMLDDAVQSGLQDELLFLDRWDRAVTAFERRFDLPAPRQNLLFRLLLQNEFKLARRKRDEFADFTDEEIAEIESLVARAFTEQEGDQASLPLD